MKKFTKIITACIAVSLLILTTAFSAFAAQLDPEVESALCDYATEQITSIFQSTDADLDAEIQYCDAMGDTFSAEVFRSAKDTRAKYGEYISVGTPVVSEDAGNYTISIPVNFASGNSTATIIIDGNSGYCTEFSFKDTVKEEENKSIGSLMKEASVNLIVGMGTVFAVLVFLCWVISLFKYIHKAEEKLNKKKAAEPEAPVVSVEQISGSTSSDDEIQAVIAAAIATYESETNDGIVKQSALLNGKNIRSYRR